MREFTVFMLRMGAALLAGALVGLERERARVRSSRAKELPGLRSFGVLSVYGGVAGYLASRLGGGEAYALALTAGFLLILAAYTAYRMFVGRVGGVTTPLVMLLVYSLGFAAGVGFVLEAVATSAIITLVLASKTPIARLVKAISYEELLSIFELALFYLALAPLVYTTPVTIAGVSLQVIYTFFLLVLTVNFAGYIAWRMGARASIYALLGGFVNSEATITLLARQPSGIEGLAAYVNLGMQYKTVALALAAAALSRGYGFAERVAPPLLAALLAATATALAWRPSGDVKLQFATPLELGVALRTVAVYTLLLLTAAALKPLLSRPEMLLAYAVLGGLVSATATVFALAAYLPPDPVLHAVAYLATIAAATLNKPLYARAASRDAAWRVAKVSVIMALPYAATAAAAWAAPRAPAGRA